MESYWDNNGALLFDGHVIDIQQTVNGTNLFYISSIENKEAYYISVNGTLSRAYEYDFLGLIKGTDFTILNEGMARVMKEAFEKKRRYQQATEKCLELIMMGVITTDQKKRVKSIYNRANQAKVLVIDKFHFMLQQSIGQK